MKEYRKRWKVNQSNTGRGFSKIRFKVLMHSDENGGFR